MRRVPAKNGGYFIVPEKGETNNPNGRPRKLVSQFKALGYSQSQFNDLLQAMIGLTVEELKAIDSDNTGKYDISEKLMAKGLLTDYKYGRLQAIKDVLDRLYGQATKKVQDVTPEQPLFTEIKDVSENNGDK